MRVGKYFSGNIADLNINTSKDFGSNSIYGIASARSGSLAPKGSAVGDACIFSAYLNTVSTQVGKIQNSATSVTLDINSGRLLGTLDANNFNISNMSYGYGGDTIVALNTARSIGVTTYTVTKVVQVNKPASLHIVFNVKRDFFGYSGWFRVRAGASTILYEEEILTSDWVSKNYYIPASEENKIITIELKSVVTDWNVSINNFYATTDMPLYLLSSTD